MSGGQSLELRQMLDRLWIEVSMRVPSTGSGSMASAELGLNTLAGALRLAVDERGRRHLLVPVSGAAPPVEDWRSAGVRMTTRVKVVGESPVHFLDLECRRDDLDGVFTGLAADVCAVVAHEQQISGQDLSAMLESWRRLMGGSPVQWTVPRMVGLYGELAVLERLLDRDPAATGTWTGPSGAPQDFQKHPHAMEVKSTIAPTGRLVRVHGIDQLESPPTGSLVLIWSRYAALSGGKGDSIPAIVERCLATAASAALLSHLDGMRLPAMSSTEIREVGFELIECRSYEIGPDFPTVTPVRFVGGAVPFGVQNIEYTIDLDTVPFLNEDLDAVFDRFLDLS